MKWNGESNIRVPELTGASGVMYCILTCWTCLSTTDHHSKWNISRLCQRPLVSPCRSIVVQAIASSPILKYYSNKSYRDHVGIVGTRNACPDDVTRWWTCAVLCVLLSLMTKLMWPRSYPWPPYYNVTCGPAVYHTIMILWIRKANWTAWFLMISQVLSVGKNKKIFYPDPVRCAHPAFLLMYTK